MESAGTVDHREKVNSLGKETMSAQNGFAIVVVT